MKPALVIWEDAVSDDDWVDGDKQYELDLHTIHSLGFILKEDENQVIIALSLDIQRDGSSQRLAVPKGMVREIRYLPEEVVT